MRFYEADVPQGLADVVREEMAERLGSQAQFLDAPAALTDARSVRFTLRGTPAALLDLRTVLSVYTVARFAVPRPRALLGDEHFRSLVAQLDAVRELWPAGTFGALSLSAAGADSPVMQRLHRELAGRCGLAAAAPDSGPADLHLRLRPASAGEGWESLVRLTPRPASARAWRVCNWEGALNAALAAAMVRLSRPAAGQRVLNITCGSATLAIERGLAGPAQAILGVDADPRAIACARRNTAAAGLQDRVTLAAWDARSLPVENASYDIILGDLPFGRLVGSHGDNVTLYPALMDEAARVMRSGGRMVLISYEIHLTQRALAGPYWTLERTLRVTQGGARLQPGIFLVRRV